MRFSPNRDLNQLRQIYTIVTSSSKFLMLTIILKLLNHKESMIENIGKCLPQRDQDIEDLSWLQSSQGLARDKIQRLKKTSQNLANLIESVLVNPERMEKNLVFKFCGKYENWNQSPATISSYLEKRYEGIIRSRKVKQNWNSEDMILLVWVLEQECSLQNIQSIQSLKQEHWEQISKSVPGTTGQSCMFRILSLKKTKLSDYKWGKQEEQILSQIVKQNQKNNWRLISQELYRRNDISQKIYRNAKQCKEHWSCYLNPDLRKGPWDTIEDIKLLEYIYNNNGKKNWAKLVKTFNGRTQNALKNRYSLLLQSNAFDSSIPQTQESRISQILRSLYAKKKKKISIVKNRKNNMKQEQIYQEEDKIINLEKQDKMVEIPQRNVISQQSMTLYTFKPENPLNMFPPNVLPIFYPNSQIYFIMSSQYL